MKKAIALFLSMTMLLSLALVPAHAEDASSVELDLAQGSIVISATAGTGKRALLRCVSVR